MILIFLIEQQIVIDEYIVKIITKTDKYIKAKYPQYFQQEIQPFINENVFNLILSSVFAISQNIICVISNIVNLRK